MKLNDFLRQVPLFTALDEAQLENLARLFSTRSYAKHAIIFQEGGEGDAFYILREGKVKVMLSDEEGREVIISVLRAGDTFGEMALLDSDVRSARVVAMTPCEVMRLSRGDFVAWLGSNPNMAMVIIQELSRRLRRANQTIAALATQDVQHRVARLLLSVAERREDGLIAPQPPTQKDIAAMVGASRETVNRILKRLAEDGCIAYEGRAVAIKMPLLEMLGFTGPEDLPEHPPGEEYWPG